MESGDLAKASSLQKAHPLLTKVDTAGNWRTSPKYLDVLDQTVELMTASVKQRTDELKHLEGMLPEHIYNQRKRSLLTSLKCLAPGGSIDVAAIKDSDGNVYTDPAGIATVLHTHSQSVFDMKDTDAELRAKWLRDFPPLFAGTIDDLKPTLGDVETVLKQLPTSACGLDGIPFQAYGGVRKLAARVIKAVVDSMLSGTADIPNDFNWAILICIGKSSSEFTEEGEAVYSADNTRPISIVDASNRLIASVFRIVLERCVAHNISSMQRGFLHGRAMLRNVIDVDWAAQKISLVSKKGAIVLFDGRHFHL